MVLFPVENDVCEVFKPYILRLWHKSLISVDPKTSNLGKRENPASARSTFEIAGREAQLRTFLVFALNNRNQTDNYPPTATSMPCLL
jgi:hypothetical protein